MGSVLALFLISFFLLISKNKAGFPLMVIYLTVEFLFYLWNIVSSGFRQGYGWFFHFRERDPVLWIVFAIGYLSFFAAGYFIVLLIVNRRNINQQISLIHKY